MKSTKTLGFFGMFVLIVILDGCATTHVALKPTEAKEITSIDVHIGLAQQEIYAEIVKSNARYTGSSATGGALGGLIGALVVEAVNVSIDQYHAKKAEELVQPIRFALRDYNFGRCLSEKIESELKSRTWMRINNIRVSADISKRAYEKTFADSEASAVLFVTTKYFLTPNLMILTVPSEARLYLKKGREDAELRDDNCIYKNLLFFEDRIVTMPASKEEAINCWADDEGFLTRQALDAASVGLARMIAVDLDSSGTYDGDGKDRVILRDSQVKVIRLSNGNLRTYRSLQRLRLESEAENNTKNGSSVEGITKGASVR
jgi:hypothetical protein